MNRVTTFAISVILVAASVFADQAPVRRQRSPSSVKPTGGFFFSEATGKHICILNAQGIVPGSCLDAAAIRVKKQLRAPVEVVNDMGKESIDEKIANARKNPKVGALVAFVEDDKLDSISYFADSDRCLVNVKALTRDGAGIDRVAERTGKEVWRAIGMVLGAGESIGGYSILQKVSSLEQLDAIKATAPAPEQHNRMIDSMGKLGIKMLKIGTYRDACRQGWAPAPTNDVQKAIWDEIHAIPQKPIKIEYNEKRDKGK